MPNFKSIVGGFFSDNPNASGIPRTIRCNNPWALNISNWQMTYPGYAGYTQPDGSANANKTTIYESPEQGCAAGWELLRKYAAGGHKTVRQIITRYGGGQDYSKYLDNVVSKSGLSADTSINLYDDAQLLRLAKAMMAYEAGRAIPWSDAQLLHGFKLGREFAGGPARAPAPAPARETTTPAPAPSGGWLVKLFSFIGRLFGASPRTTGGTQLVYTHILKLGSKGPKGGEVWSLQTRLRELGFSDMIIDGEFGDITDRAVRSFQTRHNLDPDGEVGELTIDALNRASPGDGEAPPLLPPPPMVGDTPLGKPAWYAQAEKDIGFRETGNNRGIEVFIRDAKTGSLGDPWCAIGVNAWLERAGVHGSRSAMARSFESSPYFIRLPRPALGCVTTMWRNSPGSGQGHVFLYDGESSKGIRGIGANEDNMVKRSFHDKSRVTGYWWPKDVPMPAMGAIPVSDAGSVVTREI